MGKVGFESERMEEQRVVDGGRPKHIERSPDEMRGKYYEMI